MAFHSFSWAVILTIFLKSSSGSSLKVDPNPSVRTAFIQKRFESENRRRCTPLPDFLGDGTGNWTSANGSNETSERIPTSESIDSSERKVSSERRKPPQITQRISKIPNDSRTVIVGNTETNIEWSGELDMLQQELKNLSRIVLTLGTSLEATLLQQRELNKKVLALTENVTTISKSVTYVNENVQSMMFKTCSRGRKNKRNKRKNSCSFSDVIAVNRKGNFSVCPETFQIFWGKKGSTCLWFSNITASWAEAMVYCTVMDSKLAILDSGVLRDNVTDYMFEQANVNMYYLGGTEYQDGTWKWLKPKKRFPKNSPPWKMGQLEKAGNAELCLAITRSKEPRVRYNWTSVPCNRKIRFVCQRELRDD